MSERCVCCGEAIPEGRQVCPACEKGAKREDKMTINEFSEKARRHCRHGFFKRHAGGLAGRPENTGGETGCRHV